MIYYFGDLRFSGEEFMQFADTKWKIIHASRKVFAEKGFHNAKMEDIADEAGVGKGTIYDYFSSKKELFETMIKEMATGFKALIQENISEDMDFDEKLKALARVKFEIIKNHKDIENLVFKNFSNFDESLMGWLEKIRNEMLEYFEGVMQEGIDSGRIKDINPKYATLMYIGGLHFLSHYICHMEDADYEKEKESALDTFLSIMFKGLEKKCL